MDKIKALFSTIIKSLVFFVYLYPVVLTVIPITHTRNLMACLGLILVFRQFGLRQFCRIWGRGLNLLFAFSVCILTSCLLNGTSDYSLLGLPITFLLTALAFYCVYIITGRPQLEEVTKYMAIACSIQAVIGLLFFLNPLFEEISYNFIKVNALAEEALLNSAGFRLHGLGANFFSAGVTNCVVLALISIFVTTNQNLYVTCFIIITILGSCMSRTTMVGAAIVMPVLIYNLGLASKTKLLIVGGIVIITFSVIIAYAKNSADERVFDLYNFGAELIINYEESGSLRSSGVSALDYGSHMPQHFVTYFIGDGLYADPKNPTGAYYMGVDQGYLRMLYYVGLIGLMFRIFSNYTFVKTISLRRNSKQYYLLFIIYLVVMYKGDIDIFQFVAPCYLLSFKLMNNEKENSSSVCIRYI